MSLKIDADAFRVTEGREVNLRKWPTTIEPLYSSNDDYQHLLEQHVSRLSALQQLFYAANSHAVLLIFQGMDAAGKDGVIKHVMSGVNPQGCQVTSFKSPNATELEHDFLWRTTRELPGRGRIGIFNRSYYEDVLIVRVHPELVHGDGTPPGKTFWQHRFRSIKELERHLHENGTRVVKFYLHLSEQEQTRRFLARIDDSEKNWKLDAADVKERKFWDQYRDAYEACLSATSTDETPWYVVPADDKRNARLIVSRIVLQTLERLKLSYPRASAAHREELLGVRKQLEGED